MTDKEINEAIAKAIPSVHLRFYGPVWTPETHGYTTDLNAMHEVEKTLSDDESDLRRWSNVLMQVIEDDDIRIAVKFQDSRVGLRYYTARATARQRAEAFLRVKCLWKEATV